MSIFLGLSLLSRSLLLKFNLCYRCVTVGFSVPGAFSYICLKIIFRFGHMHGLAESYPAEHELLCARSAIFSVISPGPRAFYSCSLFKYVEIVKKRCVPTRESLLGQISAEGGGGGGERRDGIPSFWTLPNHYLVICVFNVSARGQVKHLLQAHDPSKSARTAFFFKR